MVNFSSVLMSKFVDYTMNRTCTTFSATNAVSCVSLGALPEQAASFYQNSS
jgi:hypothetical protein